MSEMANSLAITTHRIETLEGSSEANSQRVHDFFDKLFATMEKHKTLCLEKADEEKRALEEASRDGIVYMT